MAGVPQRPATDAVLTMESPPLSFMALATACMTHNEHAGDIDIHNERKISRVVFQSRFNLTLTTDVVPKKFDRSKFRDSLVDCGLNGVFGCYITFDRQNFGFGVDLLDLIHGLL